MSAEFFLKRGNTANPIVALLSDTNGLIDLSGKTVHFRMRYATKPNDVKIDAVAVPDPDQTAHKGKVSYTFVDDDVDSYGKFFGEFVVTDGTGRVASFPNGDDYIDIEIGAGVLGLS